MQPETGIVRLIQSAGYHTIGRVKTRTAKQIGQSPWGIGCETLDRDYVDFSQVCPHLGDLGATKARLQCGWAKCEPKANGNYEWAWLDAIVNGCLEQGVRPWLETSYGNPGYAGGGGIGLAEGIPTSPQALAAWDNWVVALVKRYKDRVNEWEIWNEPDVFNAVDPDAYTDFFIRTASLIRHTQPTSRIIGLALAHRTDFALSFLKRLSDGNQTHLLDEITFHLYPHNPDRQFDVVDRLGEMIATHAPHVILRQGETGAPSESQQILALKEHPWSERKQAAWILRRMLAHHVRGIAMSLFQLADMQYTKDKGAKFEGRNSKGLLYVRPDRTVAYRKPAYFAAQHLFSLIDDTFLLHPLENLADSPQTHSLHVWNRNHLSPLAGWWRNDIAPELSTPSQLDVIRIDPIPIEDPVLIDLLSGQIFAPPSGDFWSHLPCTDSPLMLTTRKAISIQELA